jgi:acyl transferase domain-containing protein
VQCGGFVSGLEGFDNTHFRISASEAKQMDPQQRVVLEVCLFAVGV